MGKPKKETNFGRTNNNKDPKVGINISIGTKLLKDIEDNIAGESRSDKIRKCAALGYKHMVGRTL